MNVTSGSDSVETGRGSVWSLETGVAVLLLAFVSQLERS